MSASTSALFPDNKHLPPPCSFVPNAKLPFCFFQNGKGIREHSSLSMPQHFQCVNVHCALDVANEGSDQSESDSGRVSDLSVHSVQCGVQVLLHVEERGSSG